MRISLISLISVVKTNRGYKADIEFEFSDESTVTGHVDFTSFLDDVDQSHKLHYDLGELNKFLVLQGDREFVDSVFSDDDFILELEQYIS